MQAEETEIESGEDKEEEEEIEILSQYLQDRQRPPECKQGCRQGDCQ